MLDIFHTALGKPAHHVPRIGQRPAAIGIDAEHGGAPAGAHRVEHRGEHCLVCVDPVRCPQLDLERPRALFEKERHPLAQDFGRIDPDGQRTGHAATGKAQHAIERHAPLFRAQIPKRHIERRHGTGRNADLAGCLPRVMDRRAQPLFAESFQLLSAHVGSFGPLALARGHLAPAGHAVLGQRHEQILAAHIDAPADPQGKPFLEIDRTELNLHHAHDLKLLIRCLNTTAAVAKRSRCPA